MTLEEIKNSDKENLAPADVCQIIGCAPYAINIQAKEDINALPFPAFKLGTRVKIPRAAFIRWAESVYK